MQEHLFHDIGRVGTGGTATTFGIDHGEDHGQEQFGEDRGSDIDTERAQLLAAQKECVEGIEIELPAFTFIGVREGVRAILKEQENQHFTMRQMLIDQTSRRKSRGW